MKNICHLICSIFLFAVTTVSGQGLITEQAPLPCINKKFTIVAHIVRDSFGMENIAEADILTAMETVNTAFEPICVGFEICEFRYIDNFQYDDVANNDWPEMQVKFNQNNRINMYFINSQQGASDPCGFATQDGITETESGGIRILKNDCATPQSILHQLGHYFGLQNTFEGNGAELVDGSNCDTEGDLICDTPADPYSPDQPVAQFVNVGEGCRFISQLTDANGAFYIPDVGNYMSLYPDECLCGYTNEQFLKMIEVYESVAEMW